MASSIAELVATEAGCSVGTVREVMTAGLRALHRRAFCEVDAASGAVLECFFNFGGQAAYHLAGVLEQARLNSDSELPWSETLMRLDSSAGHRHAMFVQEWSSHRSADRRVLDEDRTGRDGA
jgi:hypothetical protein